MAPQALMSTHSAIAPCPILMIAPEYFWVLLSAHGSSWSLLSDLDCSYTRFSSERKMLTFKMTASGILAISRSRFNQIIKRGKAVQIILFGALPIFFEEVKKLGHFGPIFLAGWESRNFILDNFQLPFSCRVWKCHHLYYLVKSRWRYLQITAWRSF